MNKKWHNSFLEIYISGIILLFRRLGRTHCFLFAISFLAEASFSFSLLRCRIASLIRLRCLSRTFSFNIQISSQVGNPYRSLFPSSLRLPFLQILGFRFKFPLHLPILSSCHLTCIHPIAIES